MSDKTYSVSIETMFKVHQKMRLLNSIIAQMDECKLRFWVHWEEIYLYDCIIDRVKEAQALLDAFDNTSGIKPWDTTAISVDYGFYKFTMLTRSLSRCLNVLGLDALTDKTYAEDYQKFLKLFEKFHEITESLHVDASAFA
jgi:hypothetical protein